MDELFPRGADSPSLWTDEPTRHNLTAEQVYHDYGPRVYRLARKMVRNDLDAEDVTQDVLLQVVRKLPTFRGESAFPTWLHRVTVNAALAHRRKLSAHDERHVQAEDNQHLEGGQRPGSDRPWVEQPDTALSDRETRHLIRRAIARLPEGYREVFELADVEGLPNAEIAERLELSLAAVKSRLHRARDMMRKALTPHLCSLSS